jgi:thioredoxin-related protein
MKRMLPCLLVMLVGLNSCGWLGVKTKLEPAKGDKEFGPTGIPPQLRARGAGGADGSPVTPGGNKPGVADTTQFTPLEDIVFTNPDDPDAKIPELANLLATPKSKVWEESETIARNRSAREGKPLLIWFTSSTSSPMCKVLDQELFSTSDFEKWAAEKLIRLRVDASVRVKDPELSLDDARTREIDVKNYVDALKKRYKVLGHPTLILLNPSGEVIGRYVGYKRGNAEFTWGLIKHGESVSTRAYASWHDELEKKGYREWQDQRGRKIFAKLAAYSKGELVLVAPDGSRSRTTEDKLSATDRAWIAEQKKLRNLP